MLSATARWPFLLIALHRVELLCALVGSALWQLIFKLHLQPVHRLSPKLLDTHLANPMNTFMIHNIDCYSALYIGMKPEKSPSGVPAHIVCLYGHHPDSVEYTDQPKISTPHPQKPPLDWPLLPLRLLLVSWLTSSKELHPRELRSCFATVGSLRL